MRPLRHEMRAQRVVTFQTRVDVKANILGMTLPVNGRFYLVVRDDAFEASDPSPLARFLFGLDYCYRVGGTTVKVVPGLRHDWIKIAGQAITSADQIQIRRTNMNRQIWDVLIRAGAHPIGPPPSRLPGHLDGDQ